MTKTILTFLFACWYITALAQAKSYRIIETYNLRDSMNSPFRYRGVGIAALLLTAAREGKVEVFLPGEGGLVKTTREQISKNLIWYVPPELYPWEFSADYVVGDRVTYQGKQFEALNDVMDRSNPENRDTWVEIHVGPVEFSLQDIYLKMEYIKEKKSRTNLNVHLIAWDASTEIYRLIAIIKYSDCLSILNESEEVWFRFNNRRQGLVTGSIFAFDDPYFQNELKKTLIHFGIVSPAGVKTSVNKDSIAKALNNPEGLETLLNSCYLHFKNGKTGIDSINVFFLDFSGIQRAPEKLFGISFREFLKKQPAMGGFSGFKSYTQVLMGNLLKPMSADTLAIEKSSKLSAAVLPVAKDFSKGQYAYVQHIQYDLTLGPNRELLSGENPIGKYIIDAILNGSFEKRYTAFKDLEMREKIDLEEINTQIIMRPGVRFDYWDPQVDYYYGDVISFKEKNYECLMDHRGKSPDSPDSQDSWGISNMGNVVYYSPGDFIRIDLGLKTIFNQSGQIISRNPESFRFLVYDQTVGAFRPVLSISYETLKEILTNPSAGSTGPKYLKLLENGKMIGFLSDTGPILWLKN